MLYFISFFFLLSCILLYVCILKRISSRNIQLCKMEYFLIPTMSLLVPFLLTVFVRTLFKVVYGYFDIDYLYTPFIYIFVYSFLVGQDYQKKVDSLFLKSILPEASFVKISGFYSKNIASIVSTSFFAGIGKYYTLWYVRIVVFILDKGDLIEFILKSISLLLVYRGLFYTYHDKLYKAFCLQFLKNSVFFFSYYIYFFKLPEQWSFLYFIALLFLLLITFQRFCIRLSKKIVEIYLLFCFFEDFNKGLTFDKNELERLYKKRAAQFLSDLKLLDQLLDCVRQKDIFMKP